MTFGVSSNFDVKDVLTTCEQISLFLTDCRSIITQIDISFNFGQCADLGGGEGGRPPP